MSLEDSIDVAVRHRTAVEKAKDWVPEVMDEVGNAIRKFPMWPTDPIHAKSILNEEAGELEQAMVELTYEPGKSTKDDIRKEAIQTAAMAFRVLISLDKYEYIPSKMHNQGE